MHSARIIGVAALVAIATPTVAGERMRGFEEVAAQSERVDVTGLSGWHKGKFKLGDAGAGGSYRIVSQRDRHDGEVARFGESSFTLSGPGIDGAYSGRCGFETVSAQDRLRSGGWKLTLSQTLVPLTYRCSFARDGVAIGSLDLAEVASPAMSVKQQRAGIVQFGERQLTLRSVHYFERGKLPGASPLGYLIEEDDRAVAAADLNGARKRLALPRDPELRRAALLAGMALALFWDPGDAI